MILTALTLTAAATAKWLTVAKIVEAIGGGMLIIAPMVDRKIEENF